MATSMNQPPTDWVAELSAAIDQRHNDRAAEILQSIARQGEVAGVAAACVDAMTLDDEDVRNWASECLENGVAVTAADLPALIARLSPEGSADSIYWAATLIGRMTGAATPAIGALLQTAEAIVESGDVETRRGHMAAAERCVGAVGLIADSRTDRWMPAHRQVIRGLAECPNASDRLRRLAGELLPPDARTMN